MLEEINEPILIVDDNAKNVQVLGAILSQEGYLINVARSGAQALEMVSKSPPGLILLDVMMPGIDGYETCQRLKENPELKDTPIIFLTARAEKEAAVKGFEVGGVDYVTKPFDSEELMARVHTQLELRRKSRQLQAAYDELSRVHAEQERMQQELLKAEKLKTLLEAAGGAAHEINQPLQAITTHLELQSHGMEPGDPRKQDVQGVLDQVWRICDILERMKGLQAYSPRPYPGGATIIDYGAAGQEGRGGAA
jgi:two-component system, NtrC family, sensor kinase